MHEGGIATPLIARWPAGISSAGELRHTVGHVVDLAPTIVKLAGGEWPKTFGQSVLPPPPGHDLSPTFSQDLDIPHDCLWWYHEGNRAIRQGDWKLVAARDEHWQLYDLAKDRAENIDLATKHPEKVKELSDLWQAKLVEFQKLRRKDGDEKPQPKKRAATK